jgi:hypothetical protein
MDENNLTQDARYLYYKHGPLARMELGDKVQGVDYAYTLQGWIKAVNANALIAANDMGNDGSGNDFAEDVFGYSLHYNDNDYRAIGGSSAENFLSAVSSGNTTNLYNGNIARMATAITENVTGGSALNLGTQVRDFRYDELNRLVASKNVSTPSGKLTDVNVYATTYSYDANGNILNLARQDGSGSDMDKLTYHYLKDGNGKFINNRLLHVYDDVTASLELTDLEDQGRDYVQNNPATQNYRYDKIGNLIADKQEEIAEIKWNVSGKVTDIIRTAGSEKANLHFAYDAMGNRVSKTVVYPSSIEGVKEVTTYYVHDAQGNTMAVYDKKTYDNGNEELLLAEQHLYGSSRLGVTQPNRKLYPSIEEVPNDDRLYELTNHLGNVLAVVSSKKKEDGSADVKSISDYYPFGMTMPKRSFKSADYRFGFGSHEKDFDVNSGWYGFGDYGYDSRIIRRPGLDPVDQINISNYATFGNNPLMFIDVDGRWPGWVHKRIIETAFENEIATNTISDKEIAALIQASKDADGKDYQAPELSFRHSMTDGKNGQTVAEAQQKQMTFIIEQTNYYLQNNDEEKALLDLGMALHAISDEDAPTHSWQSWSGMKWYNPISLGKGLGHLVGEVTLWGLVREDAFNQSVEKVRQAYYEAKEMKDAGIDQIIVLPEFTVHGTRTKSSGIQIDRIEIPTVPADNTRVEIPYRIEDEVSN